MENKEDILKKINSDDIAIRQEAIETIQKEGDLTIVSDLFNLLLSGKNHRETTELINLLADIKENAFKELVINRIRTTHDTTAKSLLLRICWESSLDYSEYAGFFTDILLQDDFIAALEAATVLENLNHWDDAQKQQTQQKLRTAKTSDEKQFLIDNVLNKLEE